MLAYRTALRWIVLTGAIFLFSVYATTYFSKKNDSGSMQLKIFGAVPLFSLTERSGSAFTLENMKGKISVVDFIFTTCPGACPVMSGAMSGLYAEYADVKDVQFISVSVDPETDTLPVLREYAAQCGATDNRWAFLRGNIEDVKRLSERGFMLAAGNFPAGHSTKFVLVDRKGNIRGYYDSHDDASILELKKHIELLLIL